MIKRRKVFTKGDLKRYQEDFDAASKFVDDLGRACHQASVWPSRSSTEFWVKALSAVKLEVSPVPLKQLVDQFDFAASLSAQIESILSDRGWMGGISVSMNFYGEGGKRRLIRSFSFLVWHDQIIFEGFTKGA